MTDVHNYRGEPPSVVASMPETARILDILERQLALLETLTRTTWLIPAGTQITEVMK